MSAVSSGEFGISPFLLQAISSLSSPESHAARDEPEHLAMEKPQQTNGGKAVTHLLQGMNEPVSALLPATSPSSSNGDVSDRVVGAKPEEVMLNAEIQERLATQLALKQGRLVAAAATSLGGSSAQPVVSDMSMVNVLNALASQHMKANIKQEEPEAFSYVSVASPSVFTTTTTPSPSSTAADMMLQPGPDNSSGERSQPQIIIYYNNNNEAGAVASPATTHLTVGDIGGGVRGQEAVQNYRVVLHPGTAVSNPAATTITAISEPSMQTVISEAAAAAAATTTSVFDDSSGTFVAADTDVGRESSDGACPVCGDKISGYHYGVFTCESCKGFFKRTVQNKKTFTCHKQGDCIVGIQNRKKCPACRFTKCINVGMKLEAIRQDRTRGGRSSYNGSMPLVKPARPVSTPPRKVKRVSADSGGGETKAVAATVAGVGVGVVPSVVPDLTVAAAAVSEEESKNHGQLAAILNHSTTHGQQIPQSQGPPVPELLTDIMNLEALLVDDDVPMEGGEGVPDEQVFYNYLMQLTEIRLYKLVRWARNLPQFGAISTDDQILLLQNCWSDLLALGVCWRSLGSSSVLSISATHSISQEQAEALGFGDVTARLLSIAQSLQRLGVDQLEYVALKVLLLISPDVKGLREPGKVKEYQEKLSEALLSYTGAHYAQAPGKLGEMLLRLPELARVSFLAKEILLGALPPSLAGSCGLLVELLKGENAAKD
ncbi:steroidogenic factor 1-like [Babylonia areolata]|uniref:steroidogenic factor 1-like n=1 Tax=Babylonia areolata TaxID=304850 RepID=UPI003FCF07A6